MTQKNRAAIEERLKENERYPLRSMTNDELSRYLDWEKEQQAAEERSEAAKKAAETRKAEAKESEKTTTKDKK